MRVAAALTACFAYFVALWIAFACVASGLNFDTGEIWAVAFYFGPIRAGLLSYSAVGAISLVLGRFSLRRKGALLYAALGLAMAGIYSMKNADIMGTYALFAASILLAASMHEVVLFNAKATFNAAMMMKARHDKIFRLFLGY